MYNNEKVKEIMRLREVSLSELRKLRADLFADFRNKRKILIDDINAKRQGIVTTKDDGIVRIKRVQHNTESILTTDMTSELNNLNQVQTGYIGADVSLYKSHIEDISKNLNIPIAKKLGELGTLDIIEKYNIKMKPPKNSIVFNFKNSITGLNIMDGEAIRPNGYDNGVVNYDSGVFKNGRVLSGQMVDNGIWMGKGTVNLFRGVLYPRDMCVVEDLGDSFKISFKVFGNSTASNRAYLTYEGFYTYNVNSDVLSTTLDTVQFNKIVRYKIFSDVSATTTMNIERIGVSRGTHSLPRGNQSNRYKHPFISPDGNPGSASSDNYVIIKKNIFLETSAFPTPRVLTERAASNLSYDIYRNHTSFIIKLNRPHIEYDKVNIYSDDTFILQVKKGINVFFDREEDNVLIHDAKNSKLYVNAVEVPNTLFRYIPKHKDLKRWISCTGWNESDIKDLITGESLDFVVGNGDSIERVDSGIEFNNAKLNRLKIDNVDGEFTILISSEFPYKTNMPSPIFYIHGKTSNIIDRPVSWSDYMNYKHDRGTSVSIRNINNDDIDSTYSHNANIYGISYGKLNAIHYIYNTDTSNSIRGINDLSMGDINNLTIDIGRLSDEYPSKYIIRDFRMYNKALTPAEMKAEIQLLEW